VKSLSNLLWGNHAKAGPPDAERTFNVHPADPARRESALRLILGSASHAASDSELAEFLNFTRHRGIDLSRLWVAEYDEHAAAAGSSPSPAYAVLPVVSPGRTMLLLSPTHLLKQTPPHLVRELIDRILATADPRDVHLAQVLLDPQETDARQLFQSCGFDLMAELIYLHALVRSAPSDPALPPNFSWQSYSPEKHPRFAAAILASYQDSLDCPSLNGLRDVNDVIAGHKASGEFDPAHWMLLVESTPDGRPLDRGVLLLSPTPRADALELVYIGLAPESRGRQLGTTLFRKALATAARLGLSRLSLAVDSRNTPAIKLYYRHGMQRLSARLAMMRDLRRR